MSKASYLFLFFCFITANCLGQKHETKFSAAIYIGPSFPVGKFADKLVSKDTALNIPGKANVGPALQVTLNYKVTKIIGLTLLAAAQQNKQNLKSMNNYFKQYDRSDSINYNISTRNWKTGKILVGIFFKIPVSASNKFYFEPTLLAGVLKTSAPGYQFSSYELINDGSRQPLGFKKISDYPCPWAFCYQVGGDFDWQYKSRIFFLIAANYSHASTQRKVTAFTVLVPAPADPKQYDTNFEIESINVFAGAGFEF